MPLTEKPSAPAERRGRKTNTVREESKLLVALTLLARDPRKYQH